MILQKIAIIILMSLICYMGCSNQMNSGGMRKKYAIPYRAEGNYLGLYKNLVECRPHNSKVIEIVNYAKLIAKDAGYNIIGDEFIYQGDKYPIKVKVYENSVYYLVQFLPQSISISSLDLNISIEKESNKVIAIYMGS